MRTAPSRVALADQSRVATNAPGSETRTSTWATFLSSAEKLARLQWIMNVILKFIGWTCRCTTTTWIFKDTEGYYVRCLDCGRRLPYKGALLNYSKVR